MWSRFAFITAIGIIGSATLSLAQKKLPVVATQPEPCNTIDSLYAWCRKDFIPIRKEVRKKWNGSNSIIYNTSLRVPLAADNYIFYSYGKKNFMAVFGDFENDKEAGKQMVRIVEALKPCSGAWYFEKTKGGNDEYKVFVHMGEARVYAGALGVAALDGKNTVQLWIALGR